MYRNACNMCNKREREYEYSTRVESIYYKICECVRTYMCIEVYFNTL